MKISDEIRVLSNRLDMDENSYNELRELANRIDIEMIELPKDADGVPIHIGDTMCTVDRGTANVFGIYIMQHKKNVVCTFSNGRSSVYDPHKLSHERPDSLERIADDIEKTKGTVFITEKTLDGWAGRIRKLATKEDK